MGFESCEDAETKVWLSTKDLMHIKEVPMLRLAVVRDRLNRDSGFSARKGLNPQPLRAETDA